MRQDAQFFDVFNTEAGFCGIAWNTRGITHFQLPSSTEAATTRNLRRRVPEAALGTPVQKMIDVIASVRRYFAGDEVDFSQLTLDLERQSEFFQRIYAATRRVGWGQTTTYGTLAKQLGAEAQAAREVGQAMAANPIALIIPCHRVLGAGGKIGGFSAPGGATSKSRMLKLEGIHVGALPTDQASLQL